MNSTSSKDIIPSKDIISLKEIVPSTEQKLVIDQFKNEKSLQVITPAGGAKTTTSIMCIESMPDKKILYLTYNKRLKEEIRRKTKKFPNCTTHNFHACSKDFYNDDIITDRQLHQALLSNKKFRRKFEFDILIVDEAQDINSIIYQFLCKIIKECGIGDESIKQLMLIGDPKQSIYDFNGGNSKYLEQCQLHFKFDFIPIRNNDTYRCNENVTGFVNVFLNNNSSNLIKSKNAKSNNKIHYIIHNPYDSYKHVVDCIDQYGIDNIIILAPSVKKGSEQPLIKVIDNIKQKYKDKYAFYVPNDDNEEVNTDDYKGKVPCLTYHQAKGLEFQCVIVYGFDSTYDFYYNKNRIDRPNPIYVALTRSTEQLVIIAGYGHNKKIDKDTRTHKSIRYDKICQFIDVISLYRSNITDHFEVDNDDIVYCKAEGINQKVTELTKYMDGKSVNECIKYLQCEEILTESSGNAGLSNINKRVNINNLTENVSAYYGIGIPLMYWYMKHNELPGIEHILSSKIKSNDDAKTKLIIKNRVISLYQKTKTTNDRNDLIFIIFQISICMNAYDGYTHQFYQILEEGNDEELKGQLNFDFINECIERLNELHIDEIAVEKSIEKEVSARCKKCDNSIVISLNGRIDLEDKDYIYELKVKASFSDEDKLQAGIYSQITGKKCKLINIQTDQTFEIVANVNNDFIDQILKRKSLYHRLTNNKLEAINEAEKPISMSSSSSSSSSSVINESKRPINLSSSSSSSVINKENIIHTNGKSPAKMISPIRPISNINANSQLNTNQKTSRTTPQIKFKIKTKN